MPSKSASNSFGCRRELAGEDLMRSYAMSCGGVWAGVCDTKPLGLAVRFTGTQKDANDVHGSFFAVSREEEAVVAEAPAENLLPLVTLEGLHVALEGIGFHLGENPCDAFLNGLWHIAEVFLGVLREFTDPVHA